MSTWAARPHVDASQYRVIGCRRSNFRADGATASCRRRRLASQFTGRMPCGRLRRGLSLTMLEFRDILNRGARVRVEVTHRGRRVSAKKGSHEGCSASQASRLGPHRISEVGGCWSDCGRRPGFSLQPALGLPAAPGAAAGCGRRANAQGGGGEGLDRCRPSQYHRGDDGVYSELQHRRARRRGPPAPGSARRASAQGRRREGVGRGVAYRHRRGDQRLCSEIRCRRARGRGPPAPGSARRASAQGRGREGLGRGVAHRQLWRR